MKKFTSLLLTVTMLLFCNWAEAQNAKPVKPVNKNNIFAVLAKERAAKQINSSTRSKKETQKKLATYTYVDMNEQTGQITDTSEKAVINWGDNGLPVSVIITGTDDDIIEGQDIPFKVTYSNFVKINPKGGSDFDWIYEGADFDAKNGLMEVYVNNAWKSFAKIDQTISAEGFVTDILVSVWENNAWVNESKETKTYDVNGNQTVSVEQIWENGQWINEDKWVEMYDAENRNLGYENYIWENNQWVMDYGYKNTITKNAGNQIESIENESYNDTDKEWFKNIKQTYVYDASGKIKEAIEYRPMNGQWVEQTKYSNISWKEFNPNESFSWPIMVGGSKYIAMQSYYYNGFDSTWSESQKYENEFSGNNIIESRSLYYNNTTTSWDTSNRTTYAYYPNGDEKETIGYNKINDEWVISYAYGSKNTYDNDGDILTMIGLDWDSENKVFVEEDMEIYTYTNITVGIAKNHSNKASVNVYPNPVTAGNITLALANNASSVITVYDNVGKVVMQHKANTVNVTLDVNALPKGLYFINVNQAGSISKAQFIIQ